jgi:cytochrome c55X
MKTADFPRQFARFGVSVAHAVMAMSFAWHSMGDALAETGEPPSSVRAQALVRMVRQDCGSCHGMLLTGGLGPAITPQALRDIPVDSVAATIYHGRPGTPMPPWKAMVNESEARWMAERLLAGFPTENTR